MLSFILNEFSEVFLCIVFMSMLPVEHVDGACWFGDEVYTRYINGDRKKVLLESYY
jgi:hypothetical protein